ncbi:MAG: thioredoxin domain-containing protein [Patescibacteria group bacterium]|jgi:protein-disulfide isomerase
MENNSLAPDGGSPAPVGKKKTRKIIIIAALLALFFLAAYFFSLIRKNINNLNGSSNGNTNTPTIETSDDPYAGNPDAKVVIVEFGDFECPYCFQSFPVVRELIAEYKDQIKFIYRDFPLAASHAHAEMAAEAAECAHEQGKFWEMHDKLFINQQNLENSDLKIYAREIGLNANVFDQCLDSRQYKNEVTQDFNDGIFAGVDGTPTFFINGHLFEGSPTLDNFKLAIDRLLIIYKGGTQGGNQGGGD